ncbi:hypothetical protein D9613_006492 [Agrocybe pediades]|uniref:DUF6534 domain-containing protein n=1 Tax=Agrocybe pediades TaxID=84607 RepID=A0A8H4VIP1_9AGAR|nr:hypothetical protein D9613_006492 [Agrocybe pediades]
MASLPSNSTLPPIPPHIAAKTGPRILGYLFHYGLFGVLCVQVYLFYLAFPKDPLRNKLLVAAVFILELVQTIIITDSAFNVFAIGYGDFRYYNNIDIAWFSVPIITGLVAFIAEAFYAYRISVLAQSYWVASIILFLGFVQLGGAIASAIVLKHAHQFTHLLGKDYSISAGVRVLSPLCLRLQDLYTNVGISLPKIWNGGSAVCDIIIAVCMTYYLSRRGAGTGMHSTNVLLRRVIRLVIETGTITAAMATLNLVLSTLPGQPSYYLVTSETLAKFYSNSMMVVLNSRMRIGSESSSFHSMSGSGSDGLGQTVTTMGAGRPVSGRPSGRGGRQHHRRGESRTLSMTDVHFDDDSYELEESVVVSREEVTYPPQSPAEDELKENKAYLV